MGEKKTRGTGSGDARAVEEVAIGPLLDVIRRLRAPGGCPWDRAQTHASLKAYVLEEAAELADALEEGDPEHIVEELGDVLLQVILHARIAWEAEDFGLQDVFDGLQAKMIRRHPHVFGDQHAGSREDVQRLWEQARRAEGKSHRRALPRHAPALDQAFSIGAEAAKVGFDWSTAVDVLHKVREEVDEVAEALSQGQEGAIREEIGDLLFSVAQLARHVGVNPEVAAKEASRKFERRFEALHREAGSRGIPLAEHSPDELEALWQQVKRCLEAE